MDEEYFDGAEIDYAYSNDELSARIKKRNDFPKHITGLFQHVAIKIAEAGMEMSKDSATPKPEDINPELNIKRYAPE